MNADVIAAAPSAQVTVVRPHRFTTLLRREFWENKGGFMWAPIWTAAVLAALTLISLAAAMYHASGAFNGTVHIGVPIKTLIAKIPPEGLAQATAGYDIFLGVYYSVLQVVLFFVSFFYLLGSLYDDRKDRSVLFWKSLPVSDLETVLSKVVMAAFGAPLIAWFVGVVLQFVVLGFVSAFALAADVSPVQYVWGPAEPLRFAARTLAIIPVNALWALPAIGWLMLSSAYARSKPFLWAVLLPVGVGMCISIFDVFQTIKIPETWYWIHIAGRALLGITPLSWGLSDNVLRVLGKDSDGPPPVVDWTSIQAMLTSNDLWIGVVAGLVMLAGAVYFRRTREVAD